MQQSVLAEIMKLKDDAEPNLWDNLTTQIQECKYSDAIIYDENNPENLFEHYNMY
eukprot:Pgem_evm1s13368